VFEYYQDELEEFDFLLLNEHYHLLIVLNVVELFLILVVEFQIGLIEL
jgi:hypothetical protein